MSIRITRAYKTISAKAVGVIAAILPIDLLINERANIYNGQDRATARNSPMANWQGRWRTITKGRWTHRIITNISNWQNRRYGEVDYYLTQALSGYGCFNAFLYKRKRSNTEICKYCEAIDDAEHMLFAVLNGMTQERYMRKNWAGLLWRTLPWTSWEKKMNGR
ncbi:uncharacterized protein LOC115880792 [Sitophilus oryzae]|uniref:Uncharacterized protein LOC115880792 n=1 Tax=Sitophilus oryzae TaxID=7048 RepID=A0A6J2XRA5_SITOR|nr:uncharacterized protein LOC115880792 [Sitophilus oryzae]